MNRWMTALRELYSAPFLISSRSLQIRDAQTVESQRRHALARLIILHLVAVQAVGLLLAQVNVTALPVLLIQLAALGYTFICVGLLFSRWIDLGIILYIFGIFVPVAGVNWVNPGGITLLSVLVSTLLLIFILLSGLLLARRFIWLATGLSLGSLWLDLALIRIDPSLRVTGGDPRFVIGAFLSIVFISVALLTYLLARSISAGTESALSAFRQEQELANLKDQFIIYINHELRTPLVGLYGNVELVLRLGDRIDQPQRTRMLTRALQSGDTLLSMLSSALDADIIRPDAVRVQPEVLTLASQVRQIVERFDPREIGEPGMEDLAMTARDVTIAISAQLEVYADPLRLQHILNNLLSNAMKYSPTGSPIVISAALASQATASNKQPMVMISVRDAGLGVPVGEANQLFQRFVRLERDITSTVRGTGVGLYLCRILVEAMGGHIWVESAGIPGEGSTFIFTLPQQPAVSIPSASPAPAQILLQVGDAARPFTGKDLAGKVINLQDYAGKKVLLTFLRSASCPLCGVRFLHLVQQYPRFQALGLEVIAVIESSQAATQRYVDRLQPPFPVIPDPEKAIFRLYGVHASFFGMVRGLTLRLGGYWEAYRKRVGGRISAGDLTLLPADFLINPDTTIFAAHYGKDIGDHLNLKVIEQFVTEPSATTLP